MDFVEGEILAFDKPYRWTSFDVVGKARWLLCKKLGVKKLKVGHSGTLDPLATGVVVVCTGKKTKLIDQLQAHQKEYVEVHAPIIRRKRRPKREVSGYKMSYRYKYYLDDVVEEEIEEDSE